jgi:2'-5' RNA ligase
MHRREPSEILAYWLVPAKAARDYFSSAIAGLASRFEAPIFEPHVTIYASRKKDETAVEVLNDVLARCDLSAVRLSVREIQCSDEFTKTVFVQFEPAQKLLRLSRAFQNASAGHDEYQLNPHMSLIYKKMTPSARIELANSIRLPFTEVLFDSVQAIVCPRPIRSREDVEGWRVAAARTLTA